MKQNKENTWDVPINDPMVEIDPEDDPMKEDDVDEVPPVNPDSSN